MGQKVGTVVNPNDSRALKKWVPFEYPIPKIWSEHLLRNMDSVKSKGVADMNLAARSSKLLSTWNSLVRMTKRNWNDWSVRYMRTSEGTLVQPKDWKTGTFWVPQIWGEHVLLNVDTIAIIRTTGVGKSNSMMGNESVGTFWACERRTGIQKVSTFSVSNSKDMEWAFITHYR